MLNEIKEFPPYGQMKSMLNKVGIPRMVTVKQLFPIGESDIDALECEIEDQLSKILARDIKDMKIAIAVGSRGIDNIQRIVKKVVSHLLSSGAKPFIVPAMGSHGGATSTGQVQILAGLGITENTIGCPIVSSMETIQIANTEKGNAIFVDKQAHNADGVILVCRVKPHTDFHGPYESGIMKMLTVGLGKQRGADIFHSLNTNDLCENLHESGKIILSKLNVICAVALIENASHQTCHAEVVPYNCIEKREPELLQMARERMPQIYFQECDVLIVDQIGKEISGTGMDPNITGTFLDSSIDGFKAAHIVILDLTDGSRGNGIGVGMGSITTQRMVNKINLGDMYMNCLTAGNMTECKIPAVMKTDKDAVKLAIKLCKGKNLNTIKIIRIRNTLELNYIDISEGLMESAGLHPFMQIIKEPHEMVFDEDGTLL